MKKRKFKAAQALKIRVGEFVENSIEKKILQTKKEAPVLEGVPEFQTWYRVPVPEGLSGDGSEYHIYSK